MRKSNKQKKPRKDLGSWLNDIGTFLAGIAAIAEVIPASCYISVRQVTTG